MRSESEVLFEDSPFTVPVADRVKRLPPYMFGAINKRKYQLRVEGIDVIDLGMGNPTDPPDPLIVQKIEEALAVAGFTIDRITTGMGKGLAGSYDGFILVIAHA